MTAKLPELPPLPERFAVTPELVLPKDHGMGPNTMVMKSVDVFTADQLRAYAIQYAELAVAAERERCAKICEANAREAWEHGGESLMCAAAIRGEV